MTGMPGNKTGMPGIKTGTPRNHGGCMLDCDKCLNSGFPRITPDFMVVFEILICYELTLKVIEEFKIYE